MVGPINGTWRVRGTLAHFWPYMLAVSLCGIPTRADTKPATDADPRCPECVEAKAGIEAEVREFVNETTPQPPASLPINARCVWEITAGVLPGRPDEDFTKRFIFTSVMPDAEFGTLRDQAWDYASSLDDPARLNWVRVDWVWF